MSSLKIRIQRIEDAARPMIEDCERRITGYIAECKRLGVEITRKDGEYAFEFITGEMARLEYLPWPERLKQAAINHAIDIYCQKTGATEEEAIEALKPHIPELCKA